MMFSDIVWWKYSATVKRFTSAEEAFHSSRREANIWTKTQDRFHHKANRQLHFWIG